MSPVSSESWLGMSAGVNAGGLGGTAGNALPLPSISPVENDGVLSGTDTSDATPSGDRPLRAGGRILPNRARLCRDLAGFATEDVVAHHVRVARSAVVRRYRRLKSP